MDFKKDKRINNFLKNIRSKFPDSKVILFGSRSRGDNLKNSDYDFIVLSDLFEGKKLPRRLESVYECWVDDDFNVDIIPHTNSEFEDLKNMKTIIGKAAKEGIYL
jgi:hypothetical protein